MRHFSRHADRFTQRRVRVDGFADIDRITAHFDGQADFADHVAGVRANSRPADDAMRFGIKDQLGEAVVAAVGNCPTGSRPRELGRFEQVRGNRVSDDGDAVRRWALAGHGIACKSALDVADDLRAGRLVRLCPEWSGEPVPLNLICADRRQISPVVQAVRAFLAERCAELLSGMNL